MTMCADDEAYYSREQKPFNEQAAFLIEDAIDLIKQVLVKHSAAVLEEMHDQIVKRNERIAELENDIGWAVKVREIEKLKNLLSACRCHIDNPSFDEEGDLTRDVDEALGL